MTDKQTLAERLEARADFEDKRVLDEAKAAGFVPEVYSGSQTGALLREAAAIVRAVEGAATGRLYVSFERGSRDIAIDDGTGNGTGHDFTHLRGRIVALVQVGQEGSDG